MQDRLRELNKQAPSATTEQKGEGLDPVFNKKIQLLKDSLNTLQENNKKIKILKEKHSGSTLTDQEKQIRVEMNELIEENSGMFKTIKAELDKMDSEVKQAKKDNPGESETRFKEMNFNAVRSKFTDILKESQNVQVEFQSAMKTKVTRQVKLLDSKLTPEQVETICNDPQGAENLLASIMIGPGHTKLFNQVSDIQDKHKDILKLEHSVATIHQLFQDMALLVHHQGEMLENIEIEMTKAHDYIQKGVKQLDKAKKSHIKSKKCQCYLLIALLIIILIVVVPIAVKL